VEYSIEKPSTKLLALTELDSTAWVSAVKRIRGKKLPLIAAGVKGLRDEYTCTVESARALAAETLKLEWRQAYATSASGTIHRPDRPRMTCRGSRVPAGKGISGVVPGIGTEPGRATLPVASAALGRAPDIVLFLAFVA
jgi:hypothetical protein